MVELGECDEHCAALPATFVSRSASSLCTLATNPLQYLGGHPKGDSRPKVAQAAVIFPLRILSLASRWKELSKHSHTHPSMLQVWLAPEQQDSPVSLRPSFSPLSATATPPNVGSFHLPSHRPCPLHSHSTTDSEVKRKIPIPAPRPATPTEPCAFFRRRSIHTRARRPLPQRASQPVRLGFLVSSATDRRRMMQIQRVRKAGWSQKVCPLPQSHETLVAGGVSG